MFDFTHLIKSLQISCFLSRSEPPRFLLRLIVDPAAVDKEGDMSRTFSGIVSRLQFSTFIRPSSERPADIGVGGSLGVALFNALVWSGGTRGLSEGSTCGDAAVSIFFHLVFTIGTLFVPVILRGRTSSSSSCARESRRGGRGGGGTGDGLTV
jgi:hypothetical protein